MRDSHGKRIVRGITIRHIYYYADELEIFDEEHPKAGQASSSFVFTAGWVTQIGLGIIVNIPAAPFGATKLRRIII